MTFYFLIGPDHSIVSAFVWNGAYLYKKKIITRGYINIVLYIRIFLWNPFTNGRPPNNLFGAVVPFTQNIVFHTTLRTGDADLRFYITTVQDGWRKSAFITRACFPCTIHLIMQYIEPVSEWSCWRMFIETWPHSELTFRQRASSI